MKQNKSNFKFAKNCAIAYFFGWLIFSPVPGENSNQPQQPIETIYIRSGAKQYENPAPAQFPTNQSPHKLVQNQKVYMLKLVLAWIISMDKIPLNVLDTRQTFLFKMHDRTRLLEILNSFSWFYH